MTVRVEGDLGVVLENFGRMWSCEDLVGEGTEALDLSEDGF